MRNKSKETNRERNDHLHARERSGGYVGGKGGVPRIEYVRWASFIPTVLAPCYQSPQVP